MTADEPVEGSGTIAVVSEWEQVEPELRERAYRRMDSDPEVLFEQDGWLSVSADVIFARLHGMDDEIVADGLRLLRAEPIIQMPIVQPMRFDLGDHPTSLDLPKRANYACQNGFVRIALDWRYAPPWLTEPTANNFTFSVLYLRYRRRLS